MIPLLDLSSRDIVEMSREEKPEVSSREKFEAAIHLLVDYHRRHGMKEFVPAIENVLKTLREREGDSA